MPIHGSVNLAGIEPPLLRLFGGLLASPGHGSLEVLRELAGEHAWLGESLADLEKTPLEEWQAEHARLFISGHPKTVCPPFESVFLNGAMFGESCDLLADLYRRAGLEAEGAPPDYLGTMLECAAWLMEQRCDQSNALLQELWNEHLAAWVPGFGASLQAESGLLIYRQLGRRLESLFDE